MHPTHSGVRTPPWGSDVPCTTNYAMRTIVCRTCAVSCVALAPLGTRQELGQKCFILIH